MEIEDYKCYDVVNLWSVVLQKSGMKPSLVFREDFLEEELLVLSQVEGNCGESICKYMERKETLWIV